MKTLDLEDEKRQATRALILVPTRELSEQISAFLSRLLVYCETDVSISNVASGTTTHLQRSIHSYLNELQAAEMFLIGRSCQINPTS